jgi:regulator of sirC expression with transglutaminase-like and TPR domain
MPYTCSAPTPLEYFGTLVQSDGDFALFEAAVSLAQDEYPELDVQTVLDEVDLLLARVRSRLPVDAAQLQKLRVLNQFFFHDLRFAGNVNDYYDPDNSFIHMLLSTRRGIPVSLALLWMELAQGLGLKVAGVGFPGHFMVKVNLPMGQSVIDPMTGKSLGREALSERLDAFVPRDPGQAAAEVPLGPYLQAAAPRDIIARMLRNLKDIYKTQEDWQRLLAVQERLVLLLPQCWGEYRDRGLAHAELGNTELALADLECYLVHSNSLLDVDAVALRLGDLRRTGS